MNKFLFFVTDAGIGVVDVVVLDPHGHKDTIRPMVSKKSEEKWYVEYTAQVEGMHSVNVFFAGKPIPKSPFGVGVSPGKFAVRADVIIVMMTSPFNQGTPSGVVHSLQTGEPRI